MSVTPEGAVKRGVKKTLAAQRLWYFMPVQNGMGRVGIPDFIMCVPYVVQPEDVGRTLGLFVARETKAPGKLGETTPNQDREIAGIRAAGGDVKVIDDARHLCLPVSTYAEVNPPQAGVSETLQRAPGDGEPAREEQLGSTRNDSRGQGPRRRRQGCRAQAAARPRRHEREGQPGDAVS